MATTITNKTPASRRTAKSTCACADCGSLECLCRPRFFAGQLLTEEELNRLDHYIVGKNKLHNRYLHGWGVACGLDVTCDDCGNGVVVKPGYALSPCGEDIVVCQETAVDICALIQACHKQERRGCDDYRSTNGRADGGCEDSGEWILAIRYAERSSRGVTPLRGGGCSCGGSGSGCGCGGKSSSGGCGCGGKSSTGGCGCGGKTGSGKVTTSGNCGCSGHQTSTSNSRYSSSARCAPALECEPTLVCEEYSFEMYRVDPKAKPSAGALPARFLACIADLKAALPADIATNANQQAQSDWCCRTRDGLLDYLDSHPSYDCELSKRVQAITCPTPNTANFSAALAASSLEFNKVKLSLIMTCICGALMPPCPDDVAGDLVPLAAITIAGKGTSCRVTSICNWTTERRYAITVPNLQYWLSILPFGRLIREAIERVCCRLIPNVRVVPPVTVNVPPAGVAINSMSAIAANHGDISTNSAAATGEASGQDEPVPAPASAFHASEATIASTQNLLQMAMSAFLNSSDSLSGDAVIEGLLGGAKSSFPDGSDENLFAFFALDQLVKPTLRSTMPTANRSDVVRGVLSALSGLNTSSNSAGDENALSAEVALLRETVATQSRAIAELQERMNRQ
ncbi:MAG: hypothetical protein ABJB74_02980 [Gemmatimonas sp.]